MGRLYGTEIDKKRWEIVEFDNQYYHSYKLMDKKEKRNYYLYHIIGIEQVAENEFLVFVRASCDAFKIVRYKSQNSKIYQLFDKTFSQFYFISNDRIMFTNVTSGGSYHCCGIYSIKENKILEEAKWLCNVSVEIYDDNPDDIKLYVEEELASYRLHNPKLLFTVDPVTLQPNSECYSQLRDSYIKVSNKEDIESIKVDDRKYMSIIEDEMYQKEREQLHQAKSKILVRKNEIK